MARRCDRAGVRRHALTEIAAGLVAWVGASLVVLSDGRRGLALGMAMATAGLAAIVWADVGPVPAVLVAIGGAAAAGRRLTSGPAGWNVMPGGSTPRFILCVAAGLLAAWVAFGVTGGHGPGLRFAAISVVGLSVARVLFTTAPETVLSGVSVLALAVATISEFEQGGAEPWPFLAAALIAAGASWIPIRAADAA